MECEAGAPAQCLWPWYRNSFHCDAKNCDDVVNYHILINKYNFDKIWSIDEVKKWIKIGKGKYDINDGEPVRFKRKFAAQLLLGPQEVARNINLLRNQLQPLLADITGNVIGEGFEDVQPSTYAFNVLEEKEEQEPDTPGLFSSHSKTSSIRLDHFKEDVLDFGKDQQRAIVKYCHDTIGNDDKFWQNKIKDINQEFKDNKDNYQKMENQQDKYELFDENIANLDTLDIDRFKLPIFEEFIRIFLLILIKKHVN